MEAMAPYLIVYLLGTVTSIFIFRQLMRYFAPESQIEGFLIDLLASAIFFMIGMLYYAWLQAVLSG